MRKTMIASTSAVFAAIIAAPSLALAADDTKLEVTVPAEVFAQADVNNDGMIDAEEYQVIVLKKQNDQLNN